MKTEIEEDEDDVEITMKNELVRVLPFVIAHLSWLNNIVALGTRRSGLIWGLQL